LKENNRNKQHLLLLCIVFSMAMLSVGHGQAVAQHYRSSTQRPYKIKNKVYYPLSSSYGFEQHGVASWYGTDFHGKRTSSGEPYDMYRPTAAHKTLPMNTMLLVRNLENNRETVVRVNDRGPFVSGRVIDLSYAAARELAFLGKGTAKVRVITLVEKNQNRGQLAQTARNLREGKYFVQIASYARTIDALKLRDRFLQAGRQAHVETYKTARKIYYRVRVAVGNNLQRAKQERAVLEANGYEGAFVVGP
jgi:rare lipoprotein A